MEDHPSTATSSPPARSAADRVQLILLGILLGVLGVEGVRSRRLDLLLISVLCLVATLVSLWYSRQPAETA